MEAKIHCTVLRPIHERDRVSANIFGLLCALGAAFTWAISGVLMKVLVEKNDPFFLNGIQSVFASALMLAVVSRNALGGQLLEIKFTTLLLLAGIALFSSVLGNSLFYMSQKSIPVSIAYPMASSYPIFAVFFSWLLIHDPLTWLNAGAAVIVVGGIGLLSRSQDPARDSISIPPTARWNQGIGLALISGVIWGIGLTATKVGTTLTDPIIVSAIMAWTATSSLMGWQILRKNLRPRLLQLNGKAWLILGVAGLIGGNGLANLLFTLAIDSIGAPRAAIITSSSPIFSAVLAMIFLKERISWLSALGILIITIGTMIVSF